MKKKFPGLDVRKLTDEYYWDDHPGEYTNTSGDLRIIESGEWMGYGPTEQNRRHILQEISTGKYYEFEETADTGVDTFITVWQNYPDMQNQMVECREMIPEEKTITVWKPALSMSQRFYEIRENIEIARMYFKENAIATRGTETSVLIEFKDSSSAELNKFDWINIRGW